MFHVEQSKRMFHVKHAVHYSSQLCLCDTLWYAVIRCLTRVEVCCGTGSSGRQPKGWSR